MRAVDSAAEIFKCISVSLALRQINIYKRVTRTKDNLFPVPFLTRRQTYRGKFLKQYQNESDGRKQEVFYTLVLFISATTYVF